MDIKCPICASNVSFGTVGDWNSLRDLQPLNCPYKNFSGCVTRERALASVLFSLVPRTAIVQQEIYECSPVMRGLSLWLKQNCQNYHPTGYFPDKAFGTIVNGLRNENLERLTVEDRCVDIWLHLDVLEHLFDPFAALREIYRTLRAGGMCLFTVPTYSDRTKSEQVAWMHQNGSVEIKGDPEFHGNPQNPEKRSLVTWRYGQDLPYLIQHETGFDVEVRRFQSKKNAIMGPMNDVYICTVFNQSERV